MKRIGRALGGALVVLCLSCGLKADLKASQQLRNSIQKECGVAANVSFRTVNGVSAVTIILAGQPTMDPKTAKARIESLTKHEFPAATTIAILVPLS